MYIKKTQAKGIEYLKLAHNYWDKKDKCQKTNILFNFGRKDQLDMKALRRLVSSISRFLPVDEQQQIQQELGLMELPFQFQGARELGGPWLLDGLWQQLGICKTIKRLLKTRKYTILVERLIFAMVSNRALAPSSKLAIEHWVANDVMINELAEVEVHQLYRAMDFLLEAHDEIQKEVFCTVANLFNLEVDIIFIDTTSTYFEIEGEDPDDENGQGLRKRNKNSKDKRSDLGQVVIGIAVTRTGIPIRCWVWSGNQSDMNTDLVDEIKRDLNDWKLGRVITVLDAGFNSEANRRVLQGAGDGYIIGEKLRVGKKGVPVAALQRGGKFKKLENGLEIKEVFASGRRFIVVRNPDEAKRDRKKREDIVREVERRLAELQQNKEKPHSKKTCELRSHGTFGRYIRQTKTGKIFLNKCKIRDEARVDGKYLVSTSDRDLSSEDVAMGYKQLWHVERVFRDLKHTVDVRPVNHSKEERIRSHVLLCWLALLLIRIAENETGQTWFQMKKMLSTIKVGINLTQHGEVWERNPIQEDPKELFKKVRVELPARYLKVPKPQKR